MSAALFAGARASIPTAGSPAPPVAAWGSDGWARRTGNALIVWARAAIPTAQQGSIAWPVRGRGSSWAARGSLPLHEEAPSLAGMYLYGFIEAGQGATIACAGVDGASPVYTVGHQGIGCVVSEYTGEGFEALSKAALVRQLLAHQQVVERVMADRTVLPAKFGTLLKDAQEVRDLLSQGHARLVDALSSIGEVVEIEVAATWDTGQVLQAISREEGVARARDALAAKGQPTVEQRAALGQLVKASMDQRREGYRERMVGFLSPCAVDVAPNALVSDEMVMNVAFLVARARQREFEAGVEQLDQLFQNEITFRVIGPLPPYSFSTVEVRRVSGRAVQQARDTLGLGETFSAAGVRRAHRLVAAEAQRGLAQGGAEAKAHFARLRVALEVLLGYCANGSAGADALVSPPFPDRWSIAIRRRQEEVALSRFGQGVVHAPAGISNE